MKIIIYMFSILILSFSMLCGCGTISQETGNTAIDASTIEESDITNDTVLEPSTSEDIINDGSLVINKTILSYDTGVFSGTYTENWLPVVQTVDVDFGNEDVKPVNADSLSLVKDTQDDSMEWINPTLNISVIYTSYSEELISSEKTLYTSVTDESTKINENDYPAFHGIDENGNEYDVIFCLFNEDSFVKITLLSKSNKSDVVASLQDEDVQNMLSSIALNSNN